MEAHYRIVIRSGSGVEVFIADIVTEDNCTGDSCSYMFSSDTITTSYSVDVEILSCVTERVHAINTSVCKKRILLCN